MASSSLSQRFEYIQESRDAFLALFPHRFDYIYAPHPEPGERPHWQTESRYPLSDRHIRQGQQLLGVRFGSQTRYALLDIDRSSVYHPQRDRFAIARIIAVLEPLGLVDYVPVTSSYSGGIHLYIPFQEPVSSYKLGHAIQGLLHRAGFKVKGGQLELFPNAKPYIAGKPTLYAAHRLPLQVGSYLLGSDWSPVYSTEAEFLVRWQFAQQRNSLDERFLDEELKHAHPVCGRLSKAANKFLADLDLEIEQGWTAHGQTNRLLGRIAMREYVFRHVLDGVEPLVEDALVRQIVRVAVGLPGYRQWCRHQYEIEERARDWARCVEASHYFHYGVSLTPVSTSPCLDSQLDRWNQQQREMAREKIRQAIADLLNQQRLPATATARYRLLTQQYSIGGQTLYRHRDLWHPTCLQNYLHTGDSNDVLVCDDALACTVKTAESPDEALSHPPTSVQSNFQLNLQSHQHQLDPLQLRQLDSQLTVQSGIRSDVQSDVQSRLWFGFQVDYDSVENPPNPPTNDERYGAVCVKYATAPTHLKSLFPGNGCNVLSALDQSDRSLSSGVFSGRDQVLSCDLSPVGLLGRSLASSVSSTGVSIEHPDLCAHQNARQMRAEAQQRAYVARMQQYLASGDRILMAEALAWAEVNPGVLDVGGVEQDFERSPSLDLSDILAEIEVHLCRLQWTPQQVRFDLQRRYGQTRRDQLTDLELVAWLMDLRNESPG